MLYHYLYDLCSIIKTGDCTQTFDLVASTESSESLIVSNIETIIEILSFSLLIISSDLSSSSPFTSIERNTYNRLGKKHSDNN